MMNMLALFYISRRSDKPAVMMSRKEDGQGEVPEDCGFLKRHRVLADSYNHNGLEVSFHLAEMRKSMSHMVFTFFYAG